MRLSVRLHIPDVFRAVGEAHAVMPVAAARAAAAVDSIVVVTVMPVAVVTDADSEGRLLRLVAPPEMGAVADWHGGQSARFTFRGPGFESAETSAVVRLGDLQPLQFKCIGSAQCDTRKGATTYSHMS